MTSVDIPSLIYLGGFAVVLAGSYLVANRRNMGRVAQQAAIWVFIFLGAIIAVGVWGDIRDTVDPRQSVAQDGAEIRVPRAPDGHYYLSLEVNGAPVRFVVDTGATDVVLRQEDAARAGIDLDRLIFSGRAITANGTVETAPVRLDRIGAGALVEQNVPAVVNRSPMQESLLGMGYLSRFASLEITGGELILTR